MTAPASGLRVSGGGIAAVLELPLCGDEVQALCASARTLK